MDCPLNLWITCIFNIFLKDVGFLRTSQWDRIFKFVFKGNDFKDLFQGCGFLSVSQGYGILIFVFKGNDFKDFFKDKKFVNLNF